MLDEKILTQKITHLKLFIYLKTILQETNLNDSTIVACKIVLLKK